MIKRTQKESDRNKTADKGQFLKGFSVAQIKKCKTNKRLEIT
jgi:hypothetical protein